MIREEAARRIVSNVARCALILTMLPMVVLSEARPVFADVMTIKLQPPNVPNGQQGFISGNAAVLRSVTVKDINNNNVTMDVPVETKGTILTLTAADTAMTKRNALLTQLGKDFPGIKNDLAPVGTDTIQFSNSAGKGIGFSRKNTPGETMDEVKTKDDPIAAMVEFDGVFGQDDASGGSADFTAGFSSDAGDFIRSVSSSLLPNLDGATIADALFQMLAPLAPSAGVTIGILDITTDDAKIVINYPAGSAHTNGGVEFGADLLGDEGTIGGAVVMAPEASSMALFSTALVGLGLVRRSRRRGSAPTGYVSPAQG